MKWENILMAWPENSIFWKGQTHHWQFAEPKTIVAKYILHFKGKTDLPEQDLEAMKASPVVEILDFAGKTLLVQSDNEQDVKKSLTNPAHWTISPETFIPIPDTRKRAEK